MGPESGPTLLPKVGQGATLRVTVQHVVSVLFFLIQESRRVFPQIASATAVGTRLSRFWIFKIGLGSDLSKPLWLPCLSPILFVAWISLPVSDLDFCLNLLRIRAPFWGVCRTGVHPGVIFQQNVSRCDFLACLSVSLFVFLPVCLLTSEPTTPHDHGPGGSNAGASPDKSGTTLRAARQSLWN